MLKRLMKRWIIARETGWIIVIVVVCGLMTASFALDTLYTTTRLAGLHETADRTNAAIIIIDRLRFEMIEAESALRGYALDGDKGELSICDTDMGSIRQDEALLSLPATTMTDPSATDDGEKTGQDLRLQVDAWLKQFSAARNTVLARPDLRNSGTRNITLPDTAVVARLNDARIRAQARLAAQNLALDESERQTDRRASLSVSVAILCIVCAFAGAAMEGRVRRRMTRTLQAERLGAIAANRTKSSFLAYTSHELRTPLNAIIGFSEFMMMGYAGPLTERQKIYLNDIRGSGMHLQALIGDILDLTKAEAGKITLAEELLDVSSLVASCIKLTEGQAKDAGVTLRTMLPGSLRQLRGDALRCKQILLNITINAIQFTPRGGLVSIEAIESTGGGLELIVSDTGRGIEAQDLPKIMEPYFQAGIEEPSHKGYGLGLPLARRITELHGGTLGLTSQPGKGTVVRVAFPASRCIEDPATPAPAVREADVVVLVPRTVRA